ncbi:hypothetical protein HWV62_38406 [Athelia sp. TMB]|nr:hypothetical protein HWV62_38406 [Athelia sp. TMB]
MRPSASSKLARPRRFKNHIRYNTFNNPSTARCRELPLVGRGQTRTNSDTARTAIAHHQCTYQLEGEPPQTFSRVMAFDGNNSMKRMYQLGDRRIRDMKPFTDSDYLLTPEYVDQFKDEVQSSRGPAVLDRTRDVLDTDDTDNADDPTDPDECTTNFKAAAEDSHKTMWGIFEETGWFVSACRHSLILWFSDMIRSGELAKYPLAHIAKALDVMEERLLFGSDIGCSLSKTIASSSLGPKFKAKKCRCCVNAFHGYTHNWACQKLNHPNVIKGLGLEDLETLERIFSASNMVAPLTRNATAYHRRVFIDLFLQQWDEEKYLNLGTMLYNNYQQARNIIDKESIALVDTLQSLGITIAQLESWESEEVEYFKTVGKEPEWDAHAVVYVELLQELRDSESLYQNRNNTFLNYTPGDYQFTPAPSSSARSAYDEDLSRTRKAETQRRVAAERRRELLIEVVAMEVKMGIETRWQPTDPQYVDTIKYMALRKYHRALDHLQKLVIQRLFELNKLNISGTGYHMRTHIAKSINTRCKAIENAVKKYNAAATAVHPPRATLDWTKASHYAFLEEFELLRDTRQDIRAKPWAQPVVRVAMKQLQRIQRAHEEISTCHIHVRRLHTHLLDENADLARIVTDLQAKADPIAGAVEDYVIRRCAANAHLLKRVTPHQGSE